MLILSCFITGDDYQMLKGDTPQSKKKVNTLASVLLIPIIMWILIGYMMVEVVLEGKQSIALIVAGLLGLIIFIIDRSILRAPNTKSIRRMRYILGAVIALLGAVCVDEVVFKNDIDLVLLELTDNEIADKKQEIITFNEKQLVRLQNEVRSKYTTYQRNVEDAKSEADGSGGSGTTGLHSIAKLKLEIAEKSKRDYEAAQTKLSDLEGSIQLKLELAQKKILSNVNDNALLVRIKALFKLVTSDWAMAIVYVLFTTLLFIMEFLIVFLKNALPETNYERKLQAIEEIGRNRLERILQVNDRAFDPTRETKEYKKANEILELSNSSIYN